MATTQVLRGYVTRNGNGKYDMHTVDNTIVGTNYDTAGAAQRDLDAKLSRHLTWAQAQNAIIEEWLGYELVVTP